MARPFGSFRLDFYGEAEVKVTDTTPDPGADPAKNFSFSCPFVYAVKLLSNFPPPTGRQIVDEVYGRLSQRTENKQLDQMDTVLLGVCSDYHCEIVDKRTEGSKVYTADFFSTNAGVDCRTRIASGDEDRLHRAAIDLGFEWFKRRWQKFYEVDVGGTSLIGVSMLLFEKVLFEKLNQLPQAVENVLLGFPIANGCTAEWSDWVAKHSQ